MTSHRLLIYFQYLSMFKAFTNALRAGINQTPYITKNYVDNINAYISPNKRDSLGAYLIKTCTCKSFRDENSAHKYYKDEASLHCEFSDVLSKLFCLTKAVKFHFKQCHCHFKVKQTINFSISLTLMDHNISK